MQASEGGAVLCMKGKNCVAIAGDTKYGLGYTQHSANLHKIFQINKNCLMGGVGIPSDLKELSDRMKRNATRTIYKFYFLYVIYS